MIRSAIALALGILIAIFVIAYGAIQSGDGYESETDIGAPTDSGYDLTDTIDSSDDMESSYDDSDYP